MRDLLLDFLKYIKDEKQLSENTVTCYRHDIEQFIDYLQGLGCSEIIDYKTEYIRAYVAGMKNEGKTNATIARKLASIRSFGKYLYGRGLINEVVAKDIIAPKVQKKIKEEKITAEMFDKLLEQVPNSPSGKRDRAMLVLLCCTNISVSELVAMKIGAFNNDTGEIAVKKGNELLPKKAYGFVADYVLNSRGILVSKNDIDNMFVNCNGRILSRQGLWKIVKKYIKLANLSENLSLQSLKSLKYT